MDIEVDSPLLTFNERRSPNLAESLGTGIGFRVANATRRDEGCAMRLRKAGRTRDLEEMIAEPPNDLAPKRSGVVGEEAIVDEDIEERGRWLLSVALQETRDRWYNIGLGLLFFGVLFVISIAGDDFGGALASLLATASFAMLVLVMAAATELLLQALRIPRWVWTPLIYGDDQMIKSEVRQSVWALRAALAGAWLWVMITAYQYGIGIDAGACQWAPTLWLGCWWWF